MQTSRIGHGCANSKHMSRINYNKLEVLMEVENFDHFHEFLSQKMKHIQLQLKNNMKYE